MSRRLHRLFIAFNSRHVELECGSGRIADQTGTWLGPVSTAQDPGLAPILRLALNESDFAAVELSDASGRCARGPSEYVLPHLRKWATEAFVSSHPDLLWLHAGAATLQGAALLLPGPAGVGKSTLVVELLKCSWRLIADDVVPIDLARRTPLPLPFNPSVRIRSAPTDADDRMAFLERSKAVVSVTSDQVAEASGPVGALVFPEFSIGRGDQVELSRLTLVSSAQTLASQCIHLGADKREGVKALWRLAGAVPAYRLRYENPSRAACELTRRWSSGLS